MAAKTHLRAETTTRLAHDIERTVNDMRAVQENLSRLTDILAQIGLDGSVHPVCGILPIVCMMKEKGISSIVLAKENETEARMIHT